MRLAPQSRRRSHRVRIVVRMHHCLGIAGPLCIVLCIALCIVIHALRLVVPMRHCAVSKKSGGLKQIAGHVLRRAAQHRSICSAGPNTQRARLS
jgi:hypothetical protein